MKFTELLDKYLKEKATYDMMVKEDYHPEHIFAACERKEKAADMMHEYIESLITKPE